MYIYIYGPRWALPLVGKKYQRLRLAYKPAILSAGNRTKSRPLRIIEYPMTRSRAGGTREGGDCRVDGLLEASKPDPKTGKQGNTGNGRRRILANERWADGWKDGSK